MCNPVTPKKEFWPKKSCWVGQVQKPVCQTLVFFHQHFRQHRETRKKQHTQIASNFFWKYLPKQRAKRLLYNTFNRLLNSYEVVCTRWRGCIVIITLIDCFTLFKVLSVRRARHVNLQSKTCGWWGGRQRLFSPPRQLVTDHRDQQVFVVQFLFKRLDYNT